MRLIRLALASSLLGTIACAHASPDGYLGSLPPASVLASNPAIGCLVITRGSWTPPAADSAALYISPPPVVELSTQRITLNPVRSAFALLPQVRMWYGQQVRAYWEPFPSSDSLELTWRIGDAGTSIRLQRYTADEYHGEMWSWYDFPTPDAPHAGVVAKKIICPKLVLHTAG